MGSIGVQTIGARFTGHCNSVEKCAFQEQITSAISNAAVLTAHNPCNCQRTLMIGNDQGVRSQRNLLTIKQNELFALLRHSHTDATVDFIQIKSMHRLPEFQHHVVRDVHSRIDAAHIRAAKTLNHPQRGRPAQVNIAQHATEVARASFSGQHFDRNDLIMNSWNLCHRRTTYRSGIKRAHLSRQTSKRQTITTVRCQIHFDTGIVQAQINAQVLANGCIGGQLHQAAALGTDLQL